ncbi:hypothetical protein ABIE33_002074 [Ensifer sp. 4252]
MTAPAQAAGYIAEAGVEYLCMTYVYFIVFLL